MEPAGKTQKIPENFQYRSDIRPLACCLASSAFAYGETNIGFARDNNEDSFCLHAVSTCEPMLFAVADGIGGHGHGDFASRLLIRMLLAGWRDLRDRMPGDPRELEAALFRLVISCNRRIFELNGAADNSVPMGTTLAMLVVMPDFAVTVHLGDSRVYVLREGKPLVQLTDDHSYVAQLVREGKITPEQAESHPLSHVILRSVGPLPDADPEIHFHERHAGDRYLVCTDGVTTHLNNERIEGFLRSAGSAAELVRSLIDASLRQGGRDNITAVSAFL